MTVKLLLFIVINSKLIQQMTTSIVGVTYRDDFDFEDRYKNLDECNPHHWHPLHMPEHCVRMYEKMIRSKIGHTMYPRVSDETSGSQNSEEVYYDELYPQSKRKSYPRTPYQKMLELLDKDIKKDPSSPKLGVIPNLGLVAIYNQEISKDSAKMIKQLSTAYAKYGQESYAEYLGYNDTPDPQIYLWDSDKNRTEDKNNLDSEDKYGNKVTRTKTNDGGLITIVETLKPRDRR